MHLSRRKLLQFCGLALATPAWAEFAINTDGSVTIVNGTGEAIFLGMRSQSAKDEHYIGWYQVPPRTQMTFGIHRPADKVWLCHTGWGKADWPGKKVVAVTRETMLKVGRARFTSPIQVALDKNETLWFADVGLREGGTYKFA